MSSTTKPEIREKIARAEDTILLKATYKFIFPGSCTDTLESLTAEHAADFKKIRDFFTAKSSVSMRIYQDYLSIMADSQCYVIQLECYKKGSESFLQSLSTLW